MKFALAQINTTAEVESNLEKVRELAHRAAREGAEVVVFPEATMTPFGSDLATAAQHHHQRWMTEMQWLASELEVVLLVGEFVLAEQEPEQGGPRKVRNVLAAYTAHGERHEYTKIHLFDAFGHAESETVQAGTALQRVNVDGTDLGLAICYDIRFPKLFAELSRAGARVMVVAASWGAGEGKVEQWQTLARARALDSNAFVVAVDQADPAVSGVPVPPKAPTGVGHSLVADPFGHVVAELGGEEDLRLVEVDPSLAEQAARSIPVLENARLGY